MNYVFVIATAVPIETTTKRFKPTPSSTDNDVMQNDTPVVRGNNGQEILISMFLFKSEKK